MRRPENASYDATAGVRILVSSIMKVVFKTALIIYRLYSQEFESRNTNVELWDTSGDHKYDIPKFAALQASV